MNHWNIFHRFAGLKNAFSKMKLKICAPKMDIRGNLNAKATLLNLLGIQIDGTVNLELSLYKN